MERIAEKVGIPLSHALRVASFYAAFGFEPRGRHLINACLGTTCHVRGMGGILGRIETALGIGAGETTADRRFTVEIVRCLGCCSLAPVMRIDEKTYGRLRQDKVEDILNKIRPALERDGGNVELVEVSDDGTVKVKLTGACAGCPMSTMTLKMGIEKILKQEIPEIKEVVAV